MWAGLISEYRFHSPKVLEGRVMVVRGRRIFCNLLGHARDQSVREVTGEIRRGADELKLLRGELVTIPTTSPNGDFPTISQMEDEVLRERVDLGHDIRTSHHDNLVAYARALSGSAIIAVFLEGHGVQVLKVASQLGIVVKELTHHR